MKRFLTLSFLLLASILFTSSAMAQYIVSGTVTDNEDVPLIGVTVFVSGTAVGTVTDMDGQFSIRIADNEPSSLTFTYVGYSTLEKEVDNSMSDITVVLEQDVTELSEVVITGLATSVKRSNLANAVAQIQARELAEITNQPTMDGALYGKFKGAEIRANSGAPGGGFAVRLRGVTSIFGDQQPLYIMDGVYLNNDAISLGTNIVSEAARGGNASTNQDDASNRIADIDPEDIETIEILKGASAAAIYGARAAGGVVIIKTKTGKPGKTKVKFGQTFGITQSTKLLGDRGWNEAKIREVYGEDDVELFRQNGINDYEDELFGNSGFLSTSRLEFSGGNKRVNFFVAGTYKDEDGIVENTGYEKASGRANIGLNLTDWLQIDLTSNYINSTADRGFFNNGNTNTTVGYALAFTRPWYDLFPDDNGIYPSVPAVGSNVLETVSLITNREDVNRFIGGITANVRLFTNSKNNLKLQLRGGLDQLALRTTSIFPSELSFFRDPSSLGGVSISGNTVSTNTNLEAILVHSWYPTSDFSFRTQLGVVQLDFDRNTVITTASGLNGSQTNLQQSTNTQVIQIIRPQQDKGFFVQEEINWRDRIIATVGVRGDKSSNNGDPDKVYYYPKANVALNLHEFDFWGTGQWSQFKLRAAFGQSARFPNFDDRFNVFEGTAIDGRSGLQTATLQGNSNIEPETQSEIEFGTDIGFFDNRLSVDFTYYIKTIDDLLLRARVPQSTGYTSRVINGGELQNRGIEIGLNATPVQGDFTWNTTVNWWKNTSEVTRLEVPDFNLGGFAASLGQYRIEEGESATQLVGTFDPEDCQTGDCSDLDPNGDGFRVYGNAEADFNLSWLNSMQFKNFELFFLIHWKQGGDAINLSTLLYDLGGTTWDFDDTDLDPDGQMTNGDYRLSINGAGPWIEDAGYIRLREIGLYYTLPKSLFDDKARIKVGVSARNIINIFDYNSYDPEVSNFGSNVLANSVEVTPFPASQRINFHLNAYF